MGIVTIGESEIKGLRRELTNKLVAETGTERGLIRFNSNPENYKKLIESIETNLGVKGIKVSFFRNLLFMKKGKRDVQLSKIDVLYQYLYGISRTEHLEQGTVFNTKDYVVYHVNIDEVQQDKLKRESRFFGARFEALVGLSSDLLPSTSTFSNDEFVLYVNMDFLKNVHGISLLRTLFIQRFLFLIVDYNIRFEFDRELIEDGTVLPHKMKLDVWAHWNKEVLDPEGVEDDKKKEYKRLFVNMLGALAVYGQTQERRNTLRSTIDAYVPYIAKLTKSKVKPLLSIYRDQENEELRDVRLNYLCVIGYRTYFESKERKEMMRYFYSFGSALEKENVFRIFTVPAKRVKNLGWKSLLSDKENKLLYQYLLLNTHLKGIKTFIQYYDKSEAKEHGSIIWNQDYVLRIDDSSLLMMDTLKDVNDYYTLHEPAYTDDDHSKLYIAHPENAALTNQVVVIKDELYMRRIHRDFIKRISYFKNVQSGTMVEDVIARDIEVLDRPNVDLNDFDIDDQNKRSLGIGPLSSNQEDVLKQEIVDFMLTAKEIERRVAKAKAE